MTSCWSELGIEPTDDIGKIKKAYAAKLKVCRPDESPEQFKKLRAAYQVAISLTKLCQVEADSSSNGHAGFEFVEDERAPVQENSVAPRDVIYVNEPFIDKAGNGAETKKEQISWKNEATLISLLCDVKLDDRLEKIVWKFASIFFGLIKQDSVHLSEDDFRVFIEKGMEVLEVSSYKEKPKFFKILFDLIGAAALRFPITEYATQVLLVDFAVRFSLRNKDAPQLDLLQTVLASFLDHDAKRDYALISHAHDLVLDEKDITTRNSIFDVLSPLLTSVATPSVEAQAQDYINVQFWSGYLTDGNWRKILKILNPGGFCAYGEWFVSAILTAGVPLQNIPDSCRYELFVKLLKMMELVEPGPLEYQYRRYGQVAICLIEGVVSHVEWYRDLAKCHGRFSDMEYWQDVMNAYIALWLERGGYVDLMILLATSTESARYKRLYEYSLRLFHAEKAFSIVDECDGRGLRELFAVYSENKSSEEVDSYLWELNKGLYIKITENLFVRYPGLCVDIVCNLLKEEIQDKRVRIVLRYLSVDHDLSVYDQSQLEAIEAAIHEGIVDRSINNKIAIHVLELFINKNIPPSGNYSFDMGEEVVVDDELKFTLLRWFNGCLSYDQQCHINVIEQLLEQFDSVAANYSEIPIGIEERKVLFTNMLPVIEDAIGRFSDKIDALPEGQRLRVMENITRTKRLFMCPDEISGLSRRQ